MSGLSAEDGWKWNFSFLLYNLTISFKNMSTLNGRRISSVYGAVEHPILLGSREGSFVCENVRSF